MSEKKIKEIREIMDLLKELVEEPQMIYLSKTNHDEYMKQMHEVVPDFSTKHPSLFGLICDRKDTTLAEIMLRDYTDHSRGLTTKEQLEERIGKAVGNAMYTFDSKYKA